MKFKILESVQKHKLKIYDEHTGEFEGYFEGDIANLFYNLDIRDSRRYTRKVIDNYYITEDGKLSIFGDVWMNNKNISYLPIHFEMVDGNFNVGENPLKSLVGCPRYAGNFEINYLTQSSTIKTLEGGPEYVGSYTLSHTLVESLKGAPKFCEGTFRIVENSNLKNLEYLPTYIKGKLELHNNKLLNSDAIGIINKSYIGYNHLDSRLGLSRNTYVIGNQRNSSVGKYFYRVQGWGD